MTDQMSNRNVEDVLSSIRRLVSQETLNSPADKAENAASVAVEKLVLTPALRVNDRAADSTTVQPEPAEPAHSDATSAQRLAAGIAVKSSLETRQSRHSASLESTIAALEAAISSSAEHWETDASGDVPPHVGGNVTALHRHMGPVVARKPAAPHLQPPAGATATDSTPDAAPASPEPLRLTIADRATQEPRVTVAATAAETEFSVPPPDLAAPTATEPPAASVAPSAAASDMQSDTPSDTAASDQPTLPDDALPGDALPDDALIDEDTLYEMVSEIVRAELQGQLGERITRNIRKLVRTEVARALAEKQYL